MANTNQPTKPDNAKQQYHDDFIEVGNIKPCMPNCWERCATTAHQVSFWDSFTYYVKRIPGVNFLYYVLADFDEVPRYAELLTMMESLLIFNALNFTLAATMPFGWTHDEMIMAEAEWSYGGRYGCFQEPNAVSGEGTKGGFWDDAQRNRTERVMHSLYAGVFLSACAVFNTLIIFFSLTNINRIECTVFDLQRRKHNMETLYKGNQDLIDKKTEALNEDLNKWDVTQEEERRRKEDYRTAELKRQDDYRKEKGISAEPGQSGQADPDTHANGDPVPPSFRSSSGMLKSAKTFETPTNAKLISWWAWGRFPVGITLVMAVVSTWFTLLVWTQLVEIKLPNWERYTTCKGAGWVFSHIDPETNAGVYVNGTKVDEYDVHERRKHYKTDVQGHGQVWTQAVLAELFIVLVLSGYALFYADFNTRKRQPEDPKKEEEEVVINVGAGEGVGI